MIGIKEISLTLAAGALLVLALAAWYTYDFSGSDITQSADQTEALDGPLTPEAQEQLANSDILDMDNNHVATFLTNRGEIQIELFTTDMPITVGNFVTLAEDGFYDNTKFHRVIEGFMIQAGDPNSREDDASAYGTGGPGYTIQDEFVSGDHLTNVRGTIAMANTGQPNSGGSQFFINVADNVALDFDKPPMTSRHPVFGRVISGMDVVQEIERTETGARDVPVEPVIIESITITQPSE